MRRPIGSRCTLVSYSPKLSTAELTLNKEAVFIFSGMKGQNERLFISNITVESLAIAFG
ncbi:hypothetical protein LEP1GSC043_3735 [Leptospira weilii str. Ecochallenge]|uniref:Uncharacterized protein n=1 Tax=Leptospira weilii str. Ecochallenge TaxID=1049986 RepID=N1U0K1_9LEPT|nr:hypothetical protein LEP1GSC043_3735 [Leptospira weilii str. Ecochallenge]